MESFPTYLKSIRDMDDILSSIKGGPSWGIEGKENLPNARPMRAD